MKSQFVEVNGVGQWINELGWAWESVLFGGRLTGHPSPSVASVTQPWNQRLLIYTMEDFPNYRLLVHNGMGVDEAAHRNQIWSQYPIPLCVSSGFFTTDFWNVNYQKYKTKALKIPQVLKQTRQNKKKPSRLRPCRPQFHTKETRAELETLRDEVKNREAVWRNLRPW